MSRLAGRGAGGSGRAGSGTAAGSRGARSRGARSRGAGGRAAGRGGSGGGYPEDAQLKRQGGVVTDHGEQLEQPRQADLGDRLAILLVVEVAPSGQGGHGAGDHRLTPSLVVVPAIT